MRDDKPSGTALVTALARAAERRRPEAERIVDDPFASEVVRAAGLPPLDQQSPLAHAVADLGLMGLLTFCVARHRAIDDWLLETVDRQGARAVVNLGSGYDARAWRLAPRLGATPWFEVDHPATLARKREVFAQAVAGASPCPGYREVGVDFEKDDLLSRLVGAGLDRAAPAFFIWEGVTYYLQRATVEATLATISRGCGPGTRVAFDFWHPGGGLRPRDIYRRVLVKLSPRLFAEPMRTDLRRPVLEAMLPRLGLRLEEVLDAPSLAELYRTGNRPIYPDLPVALAARSPLPGEG